MDREQDALKATIATLLVAAAFPAAALGDSPLTGEIPVNITTDERQYAPRVTAAPDGGFLAVWEDDGADSGEIRARRFDASGVALSGEIPINATTTGLQEFPDVDAGVVVWQAFNSGTFGIVARRITDTGQPVGAEIPVDADAFPLASARVATSPDGGFTVVWEADETTEQVMVRRFNAAGTPTTGAVLVADGTDGDVAAHPDGSVTVAWNTLAGVSARRYDAAGNPIGPVLPLAADAANVALAAAGGDFIASWESDGNVFVRRYGADGTPLGAVTQVNTTTLGIHGAPQLSVGPGGDVAVAWTGAGDGSLEAGWVRRFTGALAPLTPEMRVNVYTPSHQIVGGVALDAGAYSVVWQSEDGQDGDEEGVYARRYRSEGGTPPPTPQPPDPPPGGPPPSPPTTDPPPLPAFSKIVQLPSNRRCVSRRRFRIRIRERGGIDIARATVKVNGKRVATRRGRRVTAPIDLRGLPKGRYRVQITVVTTDGRTLTGTRRYRTCTPKRRTRRPPKI